MNKLSRNEKGFGALELVIVLVIVALIGAVGYLVYKNSHQPVKVVTVTKTVTNTASTNKSGATTSIQPDVLKISEWQIGLPITTSIADASYHIVGNTAWLSTVKLDNDQQCITYYTSYTSSGSQSYQGIARYALTDTVDILDSPNPGDNKMSASQAAKLEPDLYKQIGNYIYYYSHGNGQPCVNQTTEQTNAFSTAYKSVYGL